MSLFSLMATLGLDSSGYEKGLNDAEGKANTFGGKLKSGLANAAKMGAAAITAASGAVVAFGTASVKTGQQFDKSMSQVVATMGYTVEELNDETSEASQTMQTLRNFAQEMGSTTVFSASQAADALNYMALAGYDAETSMKMLPNVLNLAASGNMELATASDMVTDAQSALGISLDDTANLVDQMARTASKSNTSVSQLGEAILTIGGTAQFMAGGTDRLNTVLGILADNGIKGSEAGTHLRNMLLKLSSPTKEGAAVIEELGLQIFDAQGNMRDMQNIVQDLGSAMADMSDEDKVKRISALFNSRDVAAVQALLGTTTERWEELGKTIVDSEGAAKSMADVQLDNLAGDVTLLKSAYEGLQIAVSDKLTPSVREFVQFGSSALSELTEGFKNGGLEGAAEAIGSILSKGISLITGKLPEVVKLGVKLLDTLLKGIISNLPQMARAAIQIVSTIGTAIINNGPKLITAFIDVINELLLTFTDPSVLNLFVDGILSIIKLIVNVIVKNIPTVISVGMKVLDNLLSAISRNIPEIIKVAVEIIKSLISGITEAIPMLLEYIPTIIETIITIITENLSIIIEAGVEIIKSLISGIVENIPMILEAIVQLLNSLVQVITDNLQMIVQAAIDIMNTLVFALIDALPTLISFVPQIIETIVNILVENLPTIIDAGFGLLMSLVEGILNALPEIISAIVEVIKTLVKYILDNLPQFIQMGIRIVMSLVNGILDNLPAVISAILDLIVTIINTIVSELPNIFSEGSDILFEIINGIMNALPKLIEMIPQIIFAIIEAFAKGDWLQIGVNIIKGIVNGVVNMAKNLVNTVIDAVKNAVDGVKRFLGIRSPSRLFRDQIGKMIGEGLAYGIEDSAEDAVSAAENMARDVADEFDGLSASIPTDFSLTSNADGENGLTGSSRSVIINVYGAEGQNINDLAEIVSQKIAFGYDREKMVWA